MNAEFAKDLESFTLEHADPHSLAWFKTHIRPFTAPNASSCPDNPKHMNVFFVTTEGKVGPTAAGGDAVPIYFERAPLQFKGFYNTQTQEIDAEIGVLAKPGVYLKLAPLKGKANEVSAKFDDNPKYYNGEIKITSGTGEFGFSLNAALHWAGVGAKIAGEILPFVL